MLSYFRSTRSVTIPDGKQRCPCKFRSAVWYTRFCLAISSESKHANPQIMRTSIQISEHRSACIPKAFISKAGMAENTAHISPVFARAADFPSFRGSSKTNLSPRLFACPAKPPRQFQSPSQQYLNFVYDLDLWVTVPGLFP